MKVRANRPTDGLHIFAVMRTRIITRHIPQLYMHMLCIGPHCKSAIFMSVSATRGATIFRVERDDTLMHSIVHFIAKFVRPLHPNNKHKNKISIYPNPTKCTSEGSRGPRC